jgi:hypothetical protein
MRVMLATPGQQTMQTLADGEWLLRSITQPNRWTRSVISL